jgi:hypothetical protein
MRRTLAALAAGGLLGTGLYLIIQPLFHVAGLALQGAVFIVCFAVAAFLANLILERLGY